MIKHRVYVNQAKEKYAHPASFAILPVSVSVSAFAVPLYRHFNKMSAR
jgi:hypothetical protein